MNTYKLIFEENFEKRGRPNPEHWTHEVGEKWANNESQCYIDDPKNSFIQDGKLHLVATYHPNEHCKYRSARINTYGKKHFQYGKFVVRAKLPKGRGAWPAIWFLGNTGVERVRWPKCGEIDLMEFAGNRPDQVSCAIHTESYNHKINTDIGTRIKLPQASDTFHDYTLIWTKSSLSFMVDEKEILKIEKKPTDTEAEWPFDKPYYMILNLAVGGWYGGPIHDTDLPFHFEIESIKVYDIV